MYTDNYSAEEAVSKRATPIYEADSGLREARHLPVEKDASTAPVVERVTHPEDSAETAGSKYLDSRSCAHDYAARGWAVIPILAGSKTPAKGTELDGATYSPEDIALEGNVAVRVGADSNGLVDLDLDWPESRTLAPLVLPEARCTFGRASAPQSHRLVLCPEAEKHEPFLLPAQCKKDSRFSTSEGHDLCTLEIRGAASGANRYTVFPPSTHAGTGERIEWATDYDPASIDYKRLRSRAGVLAFLSVAARCWPGEGSRDDCAMALCGALLRAGHDPDDVDRWVVEAARLAGDEEADHRAKARATAKKIESDHAVTGLPKAVELLGLSEECLETFRQWLGADDTQPLATLEQMDIGWMLESEPPARRWLLNDLLPFVNGQ